jgi:hypothetical protein
MVLEGNGNGAIRGSHLTERRQQWENTPKIVCVCVCMCVCVRE